ncbi:hypothetical protein GCM10022251_38680 [Phytohabitans flavus]|uniref:OmpR/PhoB-type domain-containing protein n=1 Tax=Phytohabitans flavus TaxID=1076124 RepID=A0A6F8XVI9_9ACTN|nr:BTAD domain-containing putative transcriptional regulator [Phytohabitans flavus]BCB77807.1 hypothetical protein Pflav_042170 [Phytohabitans flavus]
MRLSVLGPVELLGPEGLPVPLGGRRQVALAALLAAEAGKVIAASRLIELLWPEQPPRGPGPALHNQVFRLRRTLSATGLRVERRDPGYLLLGDLDAVAFERLARDKSIDEAPPAQVPALLDAALGLWRGEPFLGLHDIPPLRHEAGRLVELKLSLVERAAARLIGAGDPLTAVPYLRRAVLEAPLRERTRILLIRAVAAGGDVSAAQEQFHEYRTRCAAETGLDPSPAVEAEYRRLLRGPVDASPVAEEEPEAAVPQPLAVTPVPEPVSPIVGREADVDDLAQLVGRGHRLVTLTGPGGVGKTRLAVEVATRKWGGDCAFVDLSTVTAPEDVPTAFARGLGISVASDDPVTDLGAGVGDRALLLVVDNFEQVLPAAAFLVAVLARCPNVAAVVTSRERLGVAGETEYPVGPLGVPDADAEANDILASPAAALFLDRVADRSVRASGTPEQIGTLCRQLNGLPLAIELAAALARFRSIDEVFDGLRQAFARVIGSEKEPDGLEAAIRWSYERLSPEQRRVLRMSCVFAGEFDAAAARAVCGGDGEPFDRLVALGLLRLHRADTGIRYSVPRLIGAYLEQGARDADERTAAEVAHLRHYGGLCRDPQWLDDALLARVKDGYPDMLAALRHGIEHPVDDATTLDLATAMYMYWLWGGQLREALRWLDRLDQRFRHSPAALARLGVCRGSILRHLGRLDEAEEIGQSSVEGLRQIADPEWLVTGCLLLAALADDRGAAADVVRWAEAMVETARAGVPRRLPEALGALAVAHSTACDYERAERVALEALALLADVDSPVLRAGTRINAAQALVEAGRGGLALEVLTSGLDDLRGSPEGLDSYQVNIAWAQFATGDHAGALSSFQAYLRGSGGTGQWIWNIDAVAGCACTMLGGGQLRQGALLLGGVERLLDRLGVTVSPWIRRQLDLAYAEVVRQPQSRDLVQAGAQLSGDALVKLATQRG